MTGYKVTSWTSKEPISLPPRIFKFENQKFNPSLVVSLNFCTWQFPSINSKLVITKRIGPYKIVNMDLKTRALEIQ